MEEDIINNMAAKAKSIEELIGHYSQWPENGRSVARDVARRYLIVRAERDALKAQLEQARDNRDRFHDALDHLFTGVGICWDEGEPPVDDVIAELTKARADADHLADELRKMEWVLGSDGYPYCGWCGGEEPGQEPKRKDWSGFNEDLFGMMHKHWSVMGHKPDCTRQAALAAHDALTPPEQEE